MGVITNIKDLRQNIKNLNSEDNFTSNSTSTGTFDIIDDPLSFRNVLSEYRDFKDVSKDAFGDPVVWWFKIFFYFDNEPDDTTNTYNTTGQTYNYGNSNLLGLTVDENGGANTALNYLIINGEEERAEQLKQFIGLLSQISSTTPWYFQAIDGLGEALKRDMFDKNDFAVTDDRKYIEIQCLQDAYDTRLMTLIDLYKSACFSYIYKKEIIPANLRKFDMGIFLYSQPIKTIQYPVDMDSGQFAKFNSDRSGIDDKTYRSNSKYFELHGCEFDYNSLSDCYSSLSNAEGINIIPKIKIKFDDIYEMRFNEFLKQDIGDLVALDYKQSADSYDNPNKTLEQNIYISDSQDSSSEYSSDLSQGFLKKEVQNAKNKIKESIAGAKDSAMQAVDNTATAALARANQIFRDRFLSKIKIGNVYNSGLDIRNIKAIKNAVQQGGVFNMIRKTDSVKIPLKKNVYKNLF